ncbi:hypothetical protein FRC01_002539 [Tulasnella sp. 417]|nr:hypothetical protein FRC01_002539 [Tulasnella sp. 417]
MSPPNSDFLPNDNLPSRSEIAAICLQAGYDRSGIPLFQQPDGPILAWVKYGPNVTIPEALTQDWVAKALDANPTAAVSVPRVFDAFTTTNPFFEIGYIVMQYIDLPDCIESDVELVAKAVNRLMSVPAPSSAPGPVGGGPAVHIFFFGWDSRITYKTVQELEEHVNRILKAKGDKRRVALVADTGNRLLLCPCDINPGNFKKGTNDEVVALNFWATCFMPPAFLAFAKALPVSEFARQVARHVDYPTSDAISAMYSASGYLVLCGRNDTG